ATIFTKISFSGDVVKALIIPVIIDIYSPKILKSYYSLINLSLDTTVCVEIKRPIKSSFAFT
uniref:hypothetical protein n=1 Tax=Ruminococcus bromii TaxID=40518 RepID=UPI0040288A5A